MTPTLSGTFTKSMVLTIPGLIALAGIDIVPIYLDGSLFDIKYIFKLSNILCREGLSI